MPEIRIKNQDTLSICEISESEVSRLKSLIYLMQRVHEIDFAKNIYNLKYTIAAEHVRKRDSVETNYWFEYPSIRVEEFESYCLRIRPILFKRDSPSLKDNIYPILKKIFNGVSGIEKVEYAMKCFECRSLADSILKLKSISAHITKPISNDFYIIFGGNLWLTEDFYGELFLYGNIYHWNDANDKWLKYREIEKKAGGYEEVIRCALPFMQMQLVAARILRDMAYDVLFSNGLIECIDPLPNGSEFEIVAGDGASAHHHNLSAMGDAVRKSALNDIGELDILQMMINSQPGAVMIERNQFTIRSGDFKRNIRIDANGVSPPDFGEMDKGAMVGVSSSLECLAVIPSGETSVELEHGIASDLKWPGT